MPVYEYTCETCGEGFELFVRSATQQKEPQCPRCGSNKVRKAVSLFGVSGANSEGSSAPSCGPGPI
ncbi:MAG: FmdB family zinc ribbon protein [Chloroflexota bacterium]